MGGQEGFRLDLADVPAAVAHGVPAVSVVAAAAAAALLIALFFSIVPISLQCLSTELMHLMYTLD